MKKQEDQSIQKLLKDSLLEQAPNGLVHRIMSQIAVHPARRISVQPIKAKPVAILMLVAILLLLGLALVLKPQSWFNLTMIHLNINPVWIAPVAVLALVFWGYIFTQKYLEHFK